MITIISILFMFCLFYMAMSFIDDELPESDIAAFLCFCLGAIFGVVALTDMFGYTDLKWLLS